LTKQKKLPNSRLKKNTKKKMFNTLQASGRYAGRLFRYSRRVMQTPGRPIVIVIELLRRNALNLANNPNVVLFGFGLTITGFLGININVFSIYNFVSPPLIEGGIYIFNGTVFLVVNGVLTQIGLLGGEVHQQLLNGLPGSGELSDGVPDVGEFSGKQDLPSITESGPTSSESELTSNETSQQPSDEDFEYLFKEQDWEKEQEKSANKKNLEKLQKEGDNLRDNLYGKSRNDKSRKHAKAAEKRKNSGVENPNTKEAKSNPKSKKPFPKPKTTISPNPTISPEPRTSETSSNKKPQPKH
jgi:hypothetical protein